MTVTAAGGTTDVLVVGGGGAGMTAALAASETGTDVLVLERTKSLGGATSISIGSYSAASTELQEAAGVEDSAEAHLVDMQKFVRQATNSP